MFEIIDKLLESAALISFEKDENNGVMITIVPSIAGPDVGVSHSVTTEGALKALLIDNPEYLEDEARNEFLSPADPEEEPKPLTIDNPYFWEFKADLNREIRKSIDAVRSGVCVTISAKIEFALDSIEAPEFANDSKLLQPLEYAISTTAKSEISKLKGKIDEFIARTVDGQLMLINPNKQMSLDEVISDAEEQIENDLADDEPLENDDPEEI